MSTNDSAAVSGRSPGTPAAEVTIDAALVRALLAQYHPDLADLPIHLAESGWDNMLWRLGDALAVRMPRRSAAAILIEHEQQWLPYLAPRLPLPIPVPLRIGMPDAGYPWRWSIVPWFEGTPADLAMPYAEQAQALAAFLRALHVSAPADAPQNPVRGVPLQERRAVAEERFERVGRLTHFITPKVRSLWEQALDAPIDTAPTWIHGDMHSRNLLVHDGAICAVIDWGDLAQGDRATDLASIWNVLPDVASREAAMQTYGPMPQGIWHRARGWAVMFGLMLIDSGLVNDGRLAAAGEATLRRLEEGP